MVAQFEPFYQVWTMSSDFAQNKEDWLNGTLVELDAHDIEKRVQDTLEASIRLTKVRTGGCR